MGPAAAFLHAASGCNIGLDPVQRVAVCSAFGENRASGPVWNCFDMSILAGLEVAQIGGGLAAAVCGRLLADVGARVSCIDGDTSAPLACHLNHGKTVVSADPAAERAAIAAADRILCERRPCELR